MDVHLRDLRYFVAVAELLSFTAAAEQLYVSQPSLSKQVRMLERQVGAPLFVRDRRRVALTPVGAALLPEARRVLDAAAGAGSAVEAAKAGHRASVVVGMSTSPGRGLLPAVRSRFSARHPEVTLELRQVSWQDPTAGLVDGSSDVAFVWLPLLDEDRYDWVVVARERRVVALPATHRLAEHETVAFADLLDEPFLALPASAGAARDYWLALDARGGRPPVVAREVASAEETHEAVLDGSGVVLLAAGNAPLLARDGVVVRPVEGTSPSRLALAWRRDDDRQLVRDYAEACRAVVG